MSARDKWRQIQAVLGTSQDGIPGPKDENALIAMKASALQEYQESKATGTSRTDWRGFREIELEDLWQYLPERADFLAPMFIQNARRYDLNPLFLVAISRHETAAWTSNVFRNKANAMGISNNSGAISLDSYNESIRTAAYSLSRPGGYYSRAKTLADVGKVYAPVGANNDTGNLNGYWPTSVSKYWSDLEKVVAYKDQ
jgi:hypothetical protein